LCSAVFSIICTIGTANDAKTIRRRKINFFCFCVPLPYTPDCQLILFALAIYYLSFIEVNISVKRKMMLEYFFSRMMMLEYFTTTDLVLQGSFGAGSLLSSDSLCHWSPPHT
jgi:hypothetical protein